MSAWPRGKEPKCPVKGPHCRGIIRSRDAVACFPCGRMPKDVKPVRVCPVKGPKCAGVIRSRDTRAAACFFCSRMKKARVVVVNELMETVLVKTLRKAPATLEQLAEQVGRSPGQVLDYLLKLQKSATNVVSYGNRWTIEKTPAPPAESSRYVSRRDSTFVFGVSSDQHLGSKYERLDVLNDLYDWFAARGVDRVFNAGNWIDGEDEKNRQDLAVHGLEPQIDYLAAHYPQRAGLTTYAVWGEDHEGWFARREAIDLGRFAERRMRDAGRKDWVDLGFMEARVDLVNRKTGVSSKLLNMHPGGGTAYALSYRPQKLVESLQGGEKPAVILIGHYHKMSMNLIRSVWALQVGCAQDQTPFMRKIPTEPHIGGAIVTLTQDPQTGAITGCVPEFRQYFNKDYYNGRWSKSGPVVRPLKALARA